MNKSINILCIAYLIIYSSNLKAADFHVKPSLATSVLYTDNLYLYNDLPKEQESILEVNPGINLNGRGKRLDLGLNYRMQNMAYLNNSHLNDTKHQLDATATSELLKKTFFLDLKSSYTQQALSSSGQTDGYNISPSANRSDVLTYSIRPYLQHDLGKAAKVHASYNVSKIYYDENSTATRDSINKTADVGFASGPRFRDWQWLLDYSHRTEDFDNQLRTSPTLEHVRLKNYNIITTRTRLISIIGYENNHYQTLSQDQSMAGTEWQLGLQWTPSDRTSIEATAGERYYGETVAVAIQHRARKTNLSLTYSEDVTTSGFIQSQRLAFDAAGNPIFDPTSPTTSGSVLLSKTLIAALTLQQQQTTMNLKLEAANRENQQTQLQEDNLQATASALIRLGRHNQFETKISWLERDFQQQNRSDEIIETTFSFQRQLGRNVKSLAKYSYADQSSTSDRFNYQRNIVYLGLAMTMP